MLGASLKNIFFKIIYSIGCFLFFLTPSSSYAQDALIGLGFFPGAAIPLSFADGVSGNGQVVIGQGFTAAFDVDPFRWTAGTGLVDLGELPGGSTGNAPLGVNYDGSVIVGQANGINGREAFMWTAGTGMVGLGDLPGGPFQSTAYAVNADGTVIVGEGFNTNGTEAFRWTAGTGMVSIGQLPGGLGITQAYDVSDDGSVIVGRSRVAAGFESFIWTSGTGMVGLGTLAGGSFDGFANAVSGDGLVVTGATGSVNGFEAYRWTVGTGMIGLGDLAGGAFNSNAKDINGDGSVIVGQGTSASGNEAFYWTATDGMQTVEEWLIDSGVDTSNFTILTDATGVSDDGSIVVGYGDTPTGTEAFLARSGSGILDVPSVTQSLGETNTLPELGDANLTLPLHGAHHRPLMLDKNLNSDFCGWTTIDAGYNDSEGYLLNEEIGLCRDVIDEKLRLGVAIGKSDSAQDMVLGGEQELDGQYGLFEINYVPFYEPLIFSVVGMYGQWDAQVSRRYINGASIDESSGSTDLKSGALKLAVHWDEAFKVSDNILPDTRLSPKISYTIAKTDVDGYTETGGGFPVRFDKRDLITQEIRLGIEAETKINKRKTNLRTTIEAVHRPDSNSSGVSGEVIGLFDFDIDRASDRQTWLRLGFDIDHKFENGITLGGSTFVATKGVDPDISGAITLKMPF